MSADAVPLLLGDQWTHPRAASFSPVHNPSAGEVIAQVPMCGPAEVDAAVQSAQKAYASWSKTPVYDRVAILFKYRHLLDEHFEELSRIIVRENGKTLAEARGDMRRGLELADFACSIGELAKGEYLPELASGIDAHTSREPIGVCAGITPFNFPAMVPMWMYPIAIACGNTFVLKPSEKVPLTANRLAELFLKAGLPPGVFNIVHGGRDVVDALCAHPGIASVSFVGSTSVARHVYTEACKHGKRVQAAGGAKNVLLALPDAATDPALQAILGSAFGCAGQRCMAGSLLMSVGNGDDLREQVVGAMDGLALGNTYDNPDAQMGPVIDGAARDRLFARIASAESDGLTLARDGRAGVPEDGFFVGPTLVDQVEPGRDIFRDELFGPVLSMLHPRTLDEAIEWLNLLPYGN
ncbi:MAG: CoA-acylating methylmalonate-semialdehyde dehydrogenase, partial [Candidatus Latescibacterota bacterium]|nr:CoA-acylating methylmalonate-semialdehyde dehydrogenase [Candidatus Latescibacterota bacterium]